MANAAHQLSGLTAAPLTPAIVRRLSGWPQIRVAAMAQTSVSTVRIFEIDPTAVSADLRDRLEAVYAEMRTKLLLRG